MNFLRRIDMYGAIHYGRITRNETKQRSIFGGILTLLLHSLCVMYFILVMYQWSNGEILPKSFKKKESQALSQYISEPGFMNFSIWIYGAQLIDPLQEVNNILMPFYVYQIGGVIQKPISLLKKPDGYSPYYNSKTVSIENIFLIRNEEDFSKTRELIIYFAECEPKYLKEGQSCASREMIQEYYAQTITYMSLWINLKQFNIEEKETKIIKKQVYIHYQQNLCYNAQIMLKKQNLQIDNGDLFPSIINQEIISDFTIYSHMTGDDVMYNILKQKVLINLIINLEPYTELLEISFPKIGEVLASIGSVVSVIMAFNIIIYIYNERILDKYLIKQVIEIYYPQFKQIQIHRNIFGSIKSVTLNSEIVNLKKFKDWYQIAVKKATIKLQINNNLFELTRVQSIIRYLAKKKEFLNFKSIGIKMNFLDESIVSQFDPLKMILQQGKQELTGGEFTIINIDQSPLSNNNSF